MSDGPVSAKKRLDSHQAGGIDFNTITIPSGVDLFSVDGAGDVRIEIIPYTVPAGSNNPYGSPGQKWYERTYFTHRGIGANSESYTCPAKTYGLPCPICEARAAIKRDPEGDDEIAKALAPKERQLWWIYNHAQPDKGLQLWEISHHNFGKLLDAKARSADPGDNWEFFADPKLGFTIKATFTEEYMGSNKYYKATVIDFKKRAEGLPEFITKLVQSVPVALDDVVRVLPYDQLKAIFLQQTAPAAGDQRMADAAADANTMAHNMRPSEVPGFVPPTTTAATTQTLPGQSKPLVPDGGAPNVHVFIKGGSVVHPTLGPCTVFKVNPDGTATLMDVNEDPHKNIAPWGDAPTSTTPAQTPAPSELKKGDAVMHNGTRWTIHKVAADSVVIMNAEDDIEKITIAQAEAGRSTAMVVGSYENKPAPSGVNVPSNMNPPPSNPAPAPAGASGGDGVPWDEKW